MSGELPVHVGPRAGRIAAASVIRGSVLRRCERCWLAIWIDPQSCDEMPSVHRHMCGECVARTLTPGDIIVATAATLRRVDLHLRRN
jgi:hypothetical protein